MELISTAGIPDKPASAVQRGITIANALVKMVGLNLMQACAFVGYCMKESSCDPTSYNKAEAAGTAKSLALGADCGEGIMQWSFVGTKNKARASIGLAPASYPGGITSLSMDQQIQMMIRSSFVQTALKHGLKSATSWEPAICCATIQGHGIKHAIDCYEAANGNINSETYVRACISKYNGRQDLQRSKKWGQQVFAAMGGRPGDYNGVGGGAREWKDFNLKDFPILQDEKGRYAEEPLLLGIANHLRVQSTGGQGGDGMNDSIDGSGVFQYKGSWGELTELGKKVIANANTHTMMMGSMKGQKLGYKGNRCCTSGPAGWYTNAGINLGWGWVRSGGVATDCNLARFGFVKLWDGKMGNGNPPSYMPGDVVAIYTTQAAHQHGVMWTGQEWLSDYIQKVAMCGSRYAGWETHSQLWRHPKCWTKPPV